MAEAATLKQIGELHELVDLIERAPVFSEQTLKRQTLDSLDEVLRLRTIYINASDVKNMVPDKKIPPQTLLLRENLLTKQVLRQSQRQEPVDLRQYNLIYLQSLEQFKHVSQRVNLQYEQMDFLIKKNKSSLITSFFKNKQEIDVSNRLVTSSKELKKDLQKKVKMFLLPWNDYSLDFRICCIHDEKENVEKHFWIYIKKEIDAVMARDRLIYIHMQQKHAKLLTRIKKTFNDSIKKKLIDTMLLQLNINSNKQQPIRIPSEILPPSQPQPPKINIPFYKFENYEKQSVAQMIKAWRNKVMDQKNRSRNKLFFEIKAVKLDKKLIPDEVYSVVDNLEKVRLKYIGSDQSHLIFVPFNKQVYTFLYEDFYHKILKFDVLAYKDRRQSLYTTSLTFQKIDRHVLGFSYELGLTPQGNRDKPENFEGNYPYLICLEAVVRNVGFRMNDVINYRKTRLLDQLGRVPNSYSGFMDFPYSPNNFKLVQSIVSPNDFPLTKESFERTYIDLANYLQKEQNDSKNFSIYVSQYKKTIEPYQQCYKIVQRLTAYQKKLNVLDLQRQYEKDYLFRVNEQKLFSNNVNISNYKDDFERFDSIHKSDVDMLMKRFLLLIDVSNQRERPLFVRPSISSPNKEELLRPQQAPLKYLSPMLRIGQRLINIAKLSAQYSILESTIIREENGVNQILWLFFSMIKKLYPYSLTNNLKLQLYHIRCLAQKHLPQFNRTLNRKGIGIQNFAAKYLLSLFSELSIELNFRIWDFLVGLDNPFKGRIIVVFTLMLYMQTTDLLPIIPINRFLRSVRENYNNIILEANQVYHFQKAMITFSRPRQMRQQRLQKLAQQKYLKRFILSKSADSLPKQNQGGIPYVNGSQQNSNAKLLSLNQLNYPLPEPNYQGVAVQRVQLLIHSLYILENVNVIKYRHTLVVTYGENSKEFILTSKNIFTNWYVSLPFQDAVNHLIRLEIVSEEPVLSMKLASEKVGRQRKIILSGQVSLEAFHKDKGYKVNVHLQPYAAPVQQLYQSLAIIEQVPYHNKGQSTLSLTICLKSLRSKEKIKIKNNDQYLLLCSRLLDYDWNPDSNSGLKSLQKHFNKLQKMKRPLDEFGNEQYTYLRICGIDLSEDEWIINSKVTIEELRAIFYAVFFQKAEQDIRLQFSMIYQLFAESQNFQQFDFGLMLLGLILMSNISRQKKLTLMFCLGVHYQNCLSKSMTVQTLDSLIREMHEEHGFLNGYPMLGQSTGRILEGWYYVKGAKVQQNKRNITHILQDWAYICTIRYSYAGIILGSNQDLGVLRSLFAPTTLREIMSGQLCRFEAIYTYNGSRHLWSMTVNTTHFSIQKRGVRFLNSYPKDCQIDYLDSTAEMLLNCQNLLPLQNTKNLSYQQFNTSIKDHHLFNYLIIQSTYNISEQNFKKSQLDLRPISRSSHLMEAQRNLFSDFAIYRYENCIEEWRACRVIKQDEGEPHCVVEFRQKPGEFYTIPNFQLMNMAQNLHWTDKEDSEIHIIN